MDALAFPHEIMPFAHADDPSWLRQFHAGERDVLEQCYSDHFERVLASAARILGNIDAETVTHEVFFRLLDDEKMRLGFAGGNLGAWIGKIATNAAIDVHRRRTRETPRAGDEAHDPEGRSRVDEELDAKRVIERFRREKLPPKWAGVFDARFIRQLPQRDAARELGIQRSTLVYQEQQVRELLTTFLLGLK